MNLAVHYLAVGAERTLLPTQNKRARRAAEAIAARKWPKPDLAHQPPRSVAAMLARLGAGLLRGTGRDRGQTGQSLEGK